MKISEALCSPNNNISPISPLQEAILILQKNFWTNKAKMIRQNPCNNLKHKITRGYCWRMILNRQRYDDKGWVYMWYLNDFNHEYACMDTLHVSKDSKWFLKWFGVV